MGLFEWFKKKDQVPENGQTKYPDLWSEQLKMAQAAQHFQMMLDSVEIISKTVYCNTFFYRYKFAVENAQTVLDLSRGLKNEKAACEMLDVLKSEKVNIVNDFLFRCYDAGKIQYVNKDIVPYMQDVPAESARLLTAMLESENLENVTAHPNTCDELFSLILSATIATELSDCWRKHRN